MKPVGAVLDLCVQFYNTDIHFKGHYFLRDLLFSPDDPVYEHLKDA